MTDAPPRPPLPPPPVPPPPAASVVAVVGANVLTLDGAGGLLQDQTVLVRGDRIEEVGPRAQVVVPGEATVVDAAGGYLMPGLADMHVHMSFRIERLVYLALGITTVREMWGNPATVALRDSIARGQLIGPRMIVGSPGFRATQFLGAAVVVSTAQEASAAVDAQATLGYDFIKVHEDLGEDAYRGVLLAAAQNGLPVWGHGPATVGFAQIEDQESLEHMPSGFLSEVLPPGSGGWWNSDQIDFGALAQVGTRLAANGVTVAPTLVTVSAMLTPAEESSFESREDAIYLPAGQVSTWRTRGPWGSWQIRDDTRANTLRAAKVLFDAGVAIMAGSDGGFTYVIPGFALHDELETLVEAGLTPEQALIAATRTPAEFLGEGEEAGRVSAGSRADLVLLAENPLEDVTRTRDRLGVMAAGQWLDQSEIEGLVQAALAGSIAPRRLGTLAAGHAHIDRPRDTDRDSRGGFGESLGSR